MAPGVDSARRSPARRSFQKMLRASPTPFVAGTPTVSAADYLLFDLIDCHVQLQPDRSAALLKHKLPELAAWHRQFSARSGVAAYLASAQRRP